MVMVTFTSVIVFGSPLRVIELWMPLKSPSGMMELTFTLVDETTARAGWVKAKARSREEHSAAKPQPKLL